MHSFITQANACRGVTVHDGAFFIQFIREVLRRDVVLSQIHLQNQFLLLIHDSHSYSFELHSCSQGGDEERDVDLLGILIARKNGEDMLLGSFTEGLEKEGIDVPVIGEETLILGFITTGNFLLKRMEVTRRDTSKTNGSDVPFDPDFHRHSLGGTIARSSSTGLDRRIWSIYPWCPCPWHQ